MSQFIDRLLFFRKYEGEFAGGHGVVTNENRSWEDNYRTRWQSEKIVRSTHGVNCTGSCSWKIYVKNGLVTWETQQTDYPRTRPDLPNHEPRGCPRGASYSWYLYSSNRIKYPLIRSRLLAAWRAAKQRHPDPVQAWASIQADDAERREYQKVRGLGGFVRVGWDEVNELIAAANVHTAKRWGPDRVVGFSPIPAMSMVSYAAGTRYLSLIGGTCLSFYDWYCDLPPSSPQTFGEQTDVPESADWYNAGFLILWGSNVSMTRTPDAHFYTEARYRGAKSVVIAPDFIEVARFSDLWLHPKQGTDAALAMAMVHVILKEFFLDRQVPYFQDYARRYSDLPFLVELEPREGGHAAGRFLRAADFEDALGQGNNPDWKPVLLDEATGSVVAPQGTAGFRWGEQGRWNLEPRDGETGREITPRLTLLGAGGEGGGETATVHFPYFGATGRFGTTDHPSVLRRVVPARRLRLRDGREVLAATVFDLMVAQYGLDRGLGGEAARSYDDDVPFTPAWQERATGVPRDRCIAVARGFAANAEQTKGRSMVIVGAGLNHWFHMDMSYRAIMAMLVLCGCVGRSGGGWAHYVGQEKLRPQAGWLPVAFATDWARPPRQMNGTSYFYNHTGQWRYERLTPAEMISPLADPSRWTGTLLDCNVRAERAGWLPSSPQLSRNPLHLAREARAAGVEPSKYVADALAAGSLRMSCEDPDAPENWPRNLFVWRANLLGASGKGHEYFLKHLMGTRNNVLNEESGQRPEEVVYREAPEGKLDLLVTIGFRMNTTCLYSDIVLPTATWYEKHDLNTTDMHPFIHPLQAAVDPVWGARTDWAIFRGVAEAFQRVVQGHLGEETDVVLTPLLKDTPAELAQPYGETGDWRRGDAAAEPNRTMPNITAVPRDYGATYDRFCSLGPLLEEKGNGTKGIAWDTKEEVDRLRHVNPPEAVGGRPRMRADVDAIEAILTLAPETNGHVALKAWEALGKATGRDHTHLIAARADEKLEFRDLAAQPRPILTSPVWSGIESHEVCYNAGWTNVNELIPWRTLTGRQQLYQDHPWMRDFGEGFVTYRPPIDTRSMPEEVAAAHGNGNPVLLLNFLTPHQKWGIHSTFTENLIMLTLARGGPIVWINETDAGEAGIEDNDWIEAFNRNGALVARAVVSQRIPRGAAFMYHAAERTANVPGSEITHNRGGIHNSVTRVTLKPTHMIGGYAQYSYGFNYYGTVGSNRDEFVALRKMRDVDWRDRPLEEKKDFMRQDETSQTAEVRP